MSSFSADAIPAVTNDSSTTEVAAPSGWRARLLRISDRMPPKLRRALTSKKTLALFLIAILGKLAFYGVLAWQVAKRI